MQQWVKKRASVQKCAKSSESNFILWGRMRSTIIQDLLRDDINSPE
jgi:hypothetical protein